MTLKRLVLPVAVVVALAAGTDQASAQRRHGGGDGNRDGNGSSERRGGGGEGRSRDGGQSGNRARSGDSGRSGNSGRSGDSGRSADRGRDRSAGRSRDNDRGNNGSRRVYRDNDRSRSRTVVVVPRGSSRSRAYYSRRYTGPSGLVFIYRRPFYRARIVHPFYRPYYAFRPRFSIGFGIYVGAPVAYPWNYVGLDPYNAYAPPSPYGPYAVDPNAAYGYGSTAPYPNQPYPNQPYPNQGYPDQSAYPNQSVTVDPNDDNGEDIESADQNDQRNFGGVSLDISPSDATVSVDGAYAGIVGDFSPSSAPLTLAPGSHRVVITKPGYHAITFDVDITVGQVVPYQGTLQRQ